jgi:hypothetical protein
MADGVIKGTCGRRSDHMVRLEGQREI